MNEYGGKFMRLNNLGFIMIFLTLTILSSKNTNALTPPYFRAPDYDSWWVSLTPDVPITLLTTLVVMPATTLLI